MQHELPYWIQIANALSPVLTFLGTVAIGIAAAYIARGQWRTNQDKLKLDLYDRRLAVYEAARVFMAGISGDNTVDAKNYSVFLRTTRQAAFLFDDPSIAEYLNQLARESGRLRMAMEIVQKSTSEEKRSSAITTQMEVLQWFLAQEKASEEKFAPYLKLRG